jgi:hypothetical protein
MKYIRTLSVDGKSITITKVYERGEKYILLILWKKPGEITKDEVEKVFPGGAFVKVVVHRARSPETLDWIAHKCVLVEFVKV